LRGIKKINPKFAGPPLWCERQRFQSKIEKLARAKPRVAKYLGSKTPKKVIFIPGKLNASRLLIHSQ